MDTSSITGTNREMNESSNTFHGHRCRSRWQSDGRADLATRGFVVLLYDRSAERSNEIALRGEIEQEYKDGTQRLARLAAVTSDIDKRGACVAVDLETGRPISEMNRIEQLQLGPNFCERDSVSPSIRSFLALGASLRGFGEKEKHGK
jgi:hypothetical protein